MRRNVRRVAWIPCLLLGAAFAALTGCASIEAPPPSPEVAAEVDVRATLSPGDELEFKFFHQPQLNDVQAIRPDGMVTLQLVGEVRAEGKTPGELRTELKTLYSRLFDKPEVTVLLRRMNSRTVYVTGAVNRPGRIPMPDNLTALAAIMRAGGFDEKTARLNSVIVIRQKQDKPCAYVIDVARVLSGEDTQPFHLHGQDIVYVPRTPITDVNDWIEQHITRLVPQFGFAVQTTSGNMTYGVDTSP